MGSEASEGGGSFYNIKEAEFVRHLVECLLRDGVNARNIGVITLYKAQQSKVIDMLLASR